MTDPSTARRPRLVDVAELAGVSAQTVSNVVNGRVAEMSPVTRERVEAAMRELHYVPNVQARSLRSQRTHTLAFLLLDPDPRYLADPMTDLIISGVGAVARERGYMLLIHAAQPYEMDENLFLPLLQHRADGALLLLSGETHVRRQYVDAATAITSRLVVFEDLGDADVNTVTADNRDGAYRLTRHLIDRGHRRIGFIATSTPWPMVEQRFDGFAAALADAGIELDERLTRFEGRWDAGTGEELADRLCEMPDPPTALVAGNDLLAIGAVKALKRRGIGVPHDVAVAGFDDFAFAEHVEPPLTTVRIPGFEMGQLAATRLIDDIEGGAVAPRANSLPVELVVRGST